MQSLLLETALVLLEASPVQCHSVFHDSSYWCSIWSYFLEQRGEDVSQVLSMKPPLIRKNSTVFAYWYIILVVTK